VNVHIIKDIHNAASNVMGTFHEVGNNDDVADTLAAILTAITLKANILKINTLKTS
jgi:uncharacterized protein (DUF111 family)